MDIEDREVSRELHIVNSLDDIDDLLAAIYYISLIDKK